MKQTDPRHNARIVALQKLYERHFRTHNIDEGYDGEYDLEDIKEINEEDFDEVLFNKIFTGTQKHKKLADDVIADLATEWPIEMINKVDLQILRMAIYEGFIAELTPIRVVIDEAIELAKEFGGAPSGKFINGVLGNLVNNEKLKNKLLETNDN